MVRSHAYSRVLGLLCLIAAGSWSSSACLVKSDDDAAGTCGTGGTTGGTSAMGGTGGSAAGMSGMSGTGGSSSSCTLGADKYTCAMKQATTTTFIDFTTYTADMKWGKSSGTNGGTSLYHGTDTSNLTVAADGATLNMTGTIPKGQYAGAVFWVSTCTDASMFNGVKVSLSGDATVSASLQMQSSEDYPIDTSAKKGECTFTTCDTMWSDCMPPRTTLTVSDSPSDVELPWANFTGGLPVDTFTPNQLVGVQLQLECQGDADCAVNLTLGSVAFLP